jgi:hypothetical protein
VCVRVSRCCRNFISCWMGEATCLHKTWQLNEGALDIHAAFRAHRACQPVSCSSSRAPRHHNTSPPPVITEVTVGAEGHPSNVQGLSTSCNPPPATRHIFNGTRQRLGGGLHHVKGGSVTSTAVRGATTKVKAVPPALAATASVTGEPRGTPSGDPSNVWPPKLRLELEVGPAGPGRRRTRDPGPLAALPSGSTRVTLPITTR